MYAFLFPFGKQTSYFYAMDIILFAFKFCLTNLYYLINLLFNLTKQSFTHRIQNNYITNNKNMYSSKPRSFNFVNSKTLIDQILTAHNQQIFQMTMQSNHSSLFFSTFRTQDYMRTCQYWTTFSPQQIKHSPENMSKKSTNFSENIRSFTFRNPSKKIKKILLQNQHIQQEKYHSKETTSTESDKINSTVMQPPLILKIKKLNFRNSSETIAKFKKEM